jgi:general secretion pathway protein G
LIIIFFIYFLFFGGDFFMLTFFLYRKAFTLIELLIVVAIIAILAAIAVPNFLEAQVRSKVSRIKADMRSMATALESYAVDANAYPYSGGITPTGDIHIPTQSMAGYPNKFIPPALTTPIAYMTSLLTDIFAPDIMPKPENLYFFYTNLAGAKKRFPSQWMPPHEYRLQTLGQWIFWSCGPDRDRIDLSPTQVGVTGPLYKGYYDPTNGTISNGDILRSARFTSSGN